jgi:hypothetical protein
MSNKRKIKRKAGVTVRPAVNASSDRDIAEIFGGVGTEVLTEAVVMELVGRGWPGSIYELRSKQGRDITVGGTRFSSMILSTVVRSVSSGARKKRVPGGNISRRGPLWGAGLGFCPGWVAMRASGNINRRVATGLGFS